MRLEDAQILLRFDVDGLPPAEAGAAAREAVAGGADMILLRGAALEGRLLEAAREVGAGCRGEDALFLIEDLSAVEELQADGAHLADPGSSVGLARASVGGDRLLGSTSRSANDATLALELDIDYLVHEGGAECPGVFAALRDVAAVPLFAAKLRSLSEASAIVERGTYRLVVDASTMERANIGAAVAEYSRLLGRSL